MYTNITPSDHIKHATRQSHAGTEKTLIHHVNGVRKITDYATLLNCLYGYFEPLEKLLEPYLVNRITDYGQRRKTAKMLNDINALTSATPSDFSQDLPVVRGYIEALGCFYVMEGSVLGGAIIKKIISSKSPEIPPSSFSFFSGYNAGTMDMWRSFIDQFNAQILSEEEIQLASASANECFSKLENWIRKYYHAFASSV